jgi:alcohol dehydrogenase class IV
VETLCAVVGVTPASDELAEHALGLLVPGLLRCKRDRGNREAHLQCQLGSVDAMAACTSGSVELGASHGIGHQVCFVRSTLNRLWKASIHLYGVIR